MPLNEFEERGSNRPKDTSQGEKSVDSSKGPAEIRGKLSPEKQKVVDLILVAADYLLNRDVPESKANPLRIHLMKLSGEEKFINTFEAMNNRSTEELTEDFRQIVKQCYPGHPEWVSEDGRYKFKPEEDIFEQLINNSSAPADANPHKLQVQRIADILSQITMIISIGRENVEGSEGEANSEVIKRSKQLADENSKRLATILALAFKKSGEQQDT